jgi:DNA-directed RNA polymerase specialized sigma24 family protein
MLISMLSIDDAAGLDLFRRAIGQGDESAWRMITEVYRGFLIAQARRPAIRGLVGQDDGFCVDRAFQRFWRATRSGRVGQFDDLASALKYLKMCLGSVLIDEARVQRRHAYLSLDEHVSPDMLVCGDPSEQVVDRLARRELWESIECELTDPSERLVARLTFVDGLSPRQILALHPVEFPSVFDLYRVKRNLIDRLRRSETVRRMLRVYTSSGGCR